MDCGIPFCHDGCPLGNLIPEWNDLVWRDDWRAGHRAAARDQQLPGVHRAAVPRAVRGAPACSASTAEPVTIKQVEVSIIDRAWDEGWVTPQPPERLSGKTVAVVGSGPAGLAAAQQLTRAGHTVAVLRAGRRDRRAAALRHPRVQDGEAPPRPAAGADGGRGHPVPAGRRRRRRRRPAPQLRARYDAVVLAVGATAARDLPVPGRELDGILQAMEYLPHANRAALDPAYDVPITAAGKHVVIIGGGDTGADCLGTAHRQGAASVTQLEILPRPAGRSDPTTNPWPTWPLIYRTSSAHEEGGERVYAVSTERFVGDDARVRCARSSWSRSSCVDGRFDAGGGHRARDPGRPGAAGDGLHRSGSAPGCVDQLGVELDARGNIARDASYHASVPGRLRRRRRRAGPVADRVGHRRGPRRAPRRSTPGSPAAGAAAAPDRADGAPAQRLTATAWPLPDRPHPDPRPCTLAAIGSGMRRAKIVCTLGPATSSRSRSGPWSRRDGRGPAQPQPRQTTPTTRTSTCACARPPTSTGRGVGVLVDLQGPKIRLGTFADGPVTAASAAHEFTITTRGRPRRRATWSPRPTPGCPATCRVGDRILIDDGKVALECMAVDGPRVTTPRRRGRQGLRQQGPQPARRGGQRARRCPRRTSRTCAGRCACGPT